MDWAFFVGYLGGAAVTAALLLGAIGVLLLDWRKKLLVIALVSPLNGYLKYLRALEVSYRLDIPQPSYMEQLLYAVSFYLVLGVVGSVAMWVYRRLFKRRDPA